MKVLVVMLSAVAISASTGSAADVAIGSTARLTQGDVHYTGILVKANELAPCNAASKADDIIFDPKRDKLESWGKPCPGVPRALSDAVIQQYKSGNIDLYTAYQKASTPGPI